MCIRDRSMGMMPLHMRQLSGELQSFVKVEHAFNLIPALDVRVKLSTKNAAGNRQKLLWKIVESLCIIWLQILSPAQPRRLSTNIWLWLRSVHDEPLDCLTRKCQSSEKKFTTYYAVLFCAQMQTWNTLTPDKKPCSESMPLLQAPQNSRCVWQCGSMHIFLGRRLCITATITWIY